MYIHVLLITLLTPCCMSDQYVRFNDECTYLFDRKLYLHHVICQITISDLMMNVHTCATDNTTYIMYGRSLCRFNDECTHMLCVRLMLL